MAQSNQDDDNELPVRSQALLTEHKQSEKKYYFEAYKASHGPEIEIASTTKSTAA